MQITINKLIQWHNDSTGEKWIERVLFLNKVTEEVVVINVGALDALPFLRPLAEIESAIETKVAIPLDSDSFAPPRYTEAELESPKLISSKRRRDKSYQIIKPLFTGENAVRMLFARDRARLINARLKQIRRWPKNKKVSKSIIYRYCRRW